jgi:hypothetical protein
VGRVLLIAALLMVAAGCGRGCGGADGPGAAPAALTEARVRGLCSSCHAFTPPEVLPRAAWEEVVPDMLGLMRERGLEVADVRADELAAWFAQRAPAELPLRPGPPPVGEPPVRFDALAMAPPEAPPVPGVSHVSLVQLYGDPRPELVACDMRHGLVLVGHPWEEGDTRLRVAARVPHPAHAAPCDLDGDGLTDLVVADLGSIEPADHERGAVVWLRRVPKGLFEPVPLAEGLGRVADAQPADLDGDGDLDIAVAEFGWRESGRLLVLENLGGGGAGAPPRFRRHTLDPRHGAVACPVVDIDGDGRPEVVALIAQEHEVVVAFHRTGDGMRFEAREIWRAPHPAWGSSGLQVVDLDSDGDHDLLLTNGDLLDDHRLKPYQGIGWLEQTGRGVWRRRELAPMYGVYRAEAGDVDGDGDLDVVACAMLPHFLDDVRRPLGLPSVLLLEQTKPRVFRQHVLERLACDHATLALGDVDADGDLDLAVGGFTAHPPAVHPVPAWVTLQRNLSR